MRYHVAARRPGSVRSRTATLAALVGLCALIVGLVAPAVARADGSHLSVDFVAAAPTSYDHVTGEGGTYGNRVESLEGGDFACGDIVVFFAAISVAPAEDVEHTVELDFRFLGQPTGADGVGMVDIVSASANTGDPAHVTDGDEAVSILNQAGGHPDGDVTGTIEITNLGDDPTQPGDEDTQFVLRIEANLGCTPGAAPTGNLQAGLEAGRVTSPDRDTINTGRQTIPFRNAGGIPEPVEYTLTKTANPAGPVVAGGEIGFDLTLTNTGDAPLADVMVADSLPAAEALTWMEAPDVAECSIGLDDVLACAFETIEVRGSRTVRLAAVSNAGSCGLLTNVANATAAIAGARTASGSVTVLCPAPPPPPPPPPPRPPSRPPPPTVITVVPDVDPPAIPPGGETTVTITITAGKGGARNVEVCDRVSDGLVFVRAPRARFRNGQAFWRIRRLGAGKTRRFHVRVRAERPRRRAVVVNTVCVTAANLRCRVRRPASVGQRRSTCVVRTRIRVLQTRAKKRGGGVTG